ncbi:hypothetical protein [Streptomyces sp. NPDC052494]|uniref:hypothetical protein n=1 Tax=Streptomyces sp. NPDC052494 TaxID=3365692 RepID=UPI0037CF2B44
MERHLLVRLLSDDGEACAAALTALHSGATHVVWDGAAPAGQLALVYARRLRHTRRKGIETLGLERAVQLLNQHDQPVRLGQITAADQTWAFMLFLTEDCSALVAVTGVRRTGEQAPPNIT